MKFSWRRIKKYNLLPIFWEKYNSHIFQKIGHPLERQPIFLFTRIPSVGGLCITISDGTTVICFRKSKIKSEKMLRTILLHEMVHQFQHENGLQLEHDNTFFDIANKIKSETGLDINCEENA